MLKLRVKIEENFNEETGKFEVVGPELKLEHSLVSLSKWEAKYEKPFLNPKAPLSSSEVLDYIRLMVVDPEGGGEFVDLLTQEDFDVIQEYISSKQTATWFKEMKEKKNQGEAQTSEIIYYWMFSLQIPKECETWHLNRLLTLIRVFNEKNQPEKKMSKKEIMTNNRLLNEQRKAKLKTSG